MTTTFVNGDAEHVEQGKKHLKSTAEDLQFYSEYGSDEDSWGWEFKNKFMEDKSEIAEYFNKYPKTAHFHIVRETSMDYEEVAEAKEFLLDCDAIGSFYDYGLSFDFVEAGTFDDQELGYYRFQLSWGGPSSEIRFYHDRTIEYVFLDWFVGVGFDVSEEEWAKWVYDWFEGRASINWDDISYEQQQLIS